MYRRGAPLPAVGHFTLSVAAPHEPRGSPRLSRGSPGRRAPHPVCRGVSTARNGFPPPLRLAFRLPRGSPRLPRGSPGHWKLLLCRHGDFTHVAHHLAPAAERRWRATAGCLRLSTTPLPSPYVLKFLLSLLSHRTLYRPRAARRHSCCSGLHCIVVHHVITSNSNFLHSCTAAAH